MAKKNIHCANNTKKTLGWGAQNSIGPFARKPVKRIPGEWRLEKEAAPGAANTEGGETSRKG